MSATRGIKSFGETVAGLVLALPLVVSWMLAPISEKDMVGV